MNRLVLQAVFCATLSAPAAFCGTAPAASAALDVGPLLAPVRAFSVAFNARAAYPDTAFTPDCAVLDDFPPYAWSGIGAPKRWYAGLIGTTPSERRALAATHTRIVFAHPQFARIQQQRAYLVVPGTLTLLLGGRVQTQHGRWTLAEVRGARGWRIASQAWAITDGFADD